MRAQILMTRRKWFFELMEIKRDSHSFVFIYLYYMEKNKIVTIIFISIFRSLFFYIDISVRYRKYRALYRV